jgi:NAD(P)-dependent dehydrogenase (short-subunit alcohol dehydrogenase family)
MQRFKAKTVLVTGGSSGIGLASAKAFVTEGARVIITGRDAAALEAARVSLGKDALAIRNDVAVPGAGKALAEAITAAGLFLDAVFINAGIAEFASFPEATESGWDRMFNINVRGPYFALQALLERLNTGASIVLNGTINARIGMPGASIYAASKAALISLAKNLSAELLPRGIRVNVISPGPVNTPIFGKLGLDEQTQAAVATQIQSQVPLGRMGTPEEIAATVLHLAAAESAFIVGTELIADGGMSQL